MSHLKLTHRVAILMAMFLLSVVAVLLIDPIPQDPGYHLFADTRPYLGIANFGDVTSNLGFAVVGQALNPGRRLSNHAASRGFEACRVHGSCCPFRPGEEQTLRHPACPGQRP